MILSLNKVIIYYNLKVQKLKEINDKTTKSQRDADATIDKN